MNFTNTPRGADGGGSGSGEPGVIDQEKLLARSLCIHGLFKELGRQEVRDAFCENLILQDVQSVQIIQTFDIMHDLLFPRWSSSSETREIDAEVAVTHMKLLFSRSRLTFNLNVGGDESEERSYDYWMQMIEQVESSAFWSSGKIEEKEQRGKSGLVENLTDEKHAKLRNTNKLDGKLKIESAADKGDETDESGKEKEYGTKISDKRTKHKSRRSKRAEMWREDDSSESSDEDMKIKSDRRRGGRRKRVVLHTVESSESSSEESEDSSTDTSCDRKYRRRSKHHYESVVPPVFDPEGTVSMEKYLRIYERYFITKFNGSQHECSLELARFLKGEAKAAYEALGGENLKYKRLKPKLVD